jgi:hypothetical protein
MINSICLELRNFFCKRHDRKQGTFRVTGGSLVPAVDIPTDYIRITGSRKNDGVHKRTQGGTFELVDEGDFDGAVWIMSPPADFLALVDEISAWEAKNGGVDSANMSPFQSESFGGYSYSKSSGGAGSAGHSSVPTWQSTYANRLNVYRRASLP